MSEEELLRPSDQTNFKVEVEGQVPVVYVRLHILISSLPLFKRPKKYRFHKKFLYIKGNNLKVSIGVLLDIFFL